MKQEVRLLFVICGCLLLLGGAVFAQREDFKRGPFSPTISGTTGLVTVFSADTLKRGEFAITTALHNYDRDPGDIDVTVIPFSLTFGLSNRFELAVSANFGQGVESDGFRIVPSTQLDAVPPPWRYRFYHDFPFQDRGYSNGMGDFFTALKFNVLSEEQGNPIGLALRAFIKIPSVREAKYLRRGRGTGEMDGGFDLIISKQMGIVGTHYNAGVTFVGDPGSRGQDLLDLRDELRLGFGLNIPTNNRLQGIFEISNITFIGGGTPIAGPINPVDLFGGLRFYARDSFAISAGYRYFLNHTESNPAAYINSDSHSGYTLQLAFQRRVNAVPVMQCDVLKASILEGDSTELTASASDKDYNAVLDYKWSATGGRIQGEGRKAIFYSEKSKPGVYTVTVSVTDNRGASVSCSKDITILKRNLPPVVRLEPKASTVTVGESVRIRAIASDPNNDPLTYTWTIAGERVAATGTEVVFGSAGRTPGDYSVNVRVSDGEMAATDTATVKVLPLPNKPPSVSCTVAKAEVMAGERVGVQAQGKDPDNDPLSYQWTSTGGRIEGSGTQVDLDTTGLSAGSYVITVRISDGRGGTASSTCSVHVRERIRILIDRYKVDNVGKAILDDVALKLKGDARILATITGYGDDRGTPKAQDKAALDRAEDVKKYLVEKHKIDAGRLTVKSGGSSDPVAPNTTAAGRKQNRRAEIELYVP